VPGIALTDDLKTGIIGIIRIGLIKDGNGRIVFDKRTFVDESTILSTLNAVSYFEKTEKITGFDYFIGFDLHSDAVRGGSTGAAVALGLIAMAKNKTLRPKTLITGHIDEYGNLLETGGIPLKVITAGKQSFRTIVIPKGQGMLTLYEKHVKGDKISPYGTYYVAKEISLKSYAMENFRMEVFEAENIEDSLGLLLG
jgi:PDZ domain-containing secreted protein